MKITKKQDNEKKRIEKVLTTALLDDGEMIHALYEYDLAKHIDEWYEGLLADKEQIVFVVTENNGHVAMVLITEDKTIYINEEAREKLKAVWSLPYSTNMKQLIPMMADDLANGELMANGVKIAKR